VASGLVVGIFSGTDPKALESALTAEQIDLSKVKVVSTNVADEDEGNSQLEFVDVIADMEDNSLSDDMTRGTGVLPDYGGTGVPGVGGREQTLDSFRHHDDPTRVYLAGYDIPPDEVDNFGDAVGEGRAVVLYCDAGADVASIAAAFKAAGLRNVRTF
jgi:rhodanese-related sulfurtransferase